jgi:hypothetical protein
VPTDRIVRLSDAVTSNRVSAAASFEMITAGQSPVSRPVTAEALHVNRPVAANMDLRLAIPIRPEGEAQAQFPLRKIRPTLDLNHIRPRLDDMKPLPAGPQAPPGYSRADAKLPVSPAVQPTDALLFADAKEAGKTYWLPRYRLRSDQGRYEIAHAVEADGLFTMRFGLEPVPAPEVHAATAQVLPHRLGMEIRYRTANGNIEKRLPAAELAPDARGQVLTLKLTLEERDSLLRAFRSDDARTELLVMRAIELTVPLPTAMPIQVRRVVLPAAQIAATAAAPQMHMVARPAAGVAVERIPRPVVIRPAPLPPGNTPPVVAEPRFEDYAGILEWAIPLRFDQAEHPYLFPAGASTTTAPEFERILLRYPAGDPAGRMHAYFRDVARPDRFYYLPNAFKLARTGKPPFMPALVFRVDESAAGTTEIELTCDVRPETDGKRLLAAKAELQAHVRVQAGATPPQPALEPLAARAKLRLGLPRGGAVQTVDCAVEVDLANGFLLTERFAMSDFQDVFAAMATSLVSSVLRGSVVVSTGLAADDLVPVDIRFTDMEGETFITTEVTDPAAGTVAVTMRNATESKLRIGALPAWVRRGEAMVEARIEGLDMSRPVELAPDAIVSFTVRPLQPLPGEGALDAVFDTSAVSSMPDPETLLRLTLDPTVSQESERPITVMTAADVLVSAEAPENAVRLILVEFRGNRRVTLDPATTQAEVNVAVPLIDILLRKDTEGVYKFRQTIIYRSGRQAVDSSWRESDTGLLFVPVG